MGPASAPAHNCSACPVAATLPAAESAIVRLSQDSKSWIYQPAGSPVHLVALFRDPAIRDGRPVATVLDLVAGPGGVLTAGRSCWLRQFLDVLPGLPAGITIAIDNGVRCPCATTLGAEVYRERAAACHPATAKWHAALKHPDGKPPGLVICDKDLACSLAEQGLLTRRGGKPWQCPARFLNAVGDEVTYLGVDAMIAAHPVVVQRRAEYRLVFLTRNIAKRVCALARLPVPENS